MPIHRESTNTIPLIHNHAWCFLLYDVTPGDKRVLDFHWSKAACVYRTHTHTDDVMFIGVCLRFFPTFIFKSFLLYKINNFLNNISQTSLGPLSIKWRHSTSSRAVHFCPLHATTRCVIIYNSTETRKNDTKMIISLYWLHE